MGDGAVYQPHFILGQIRLLPGETGKIVRRHQPQHGQTVRGQIAQVFRVRIGQIDVAALVASKGNGVIIHLIGNRGFFFPHSLIQTVHNRFPIQGRFALKIHDLKNHLSGAVGAERIIHAEPQGKGGKDHHQHHGGKNGHVGQTHGILLHPVDHAGDIDEMGRLAVVETLVFPQQLEQGNAARRKQQIRSENHANHRHEEQQHGGHCICHGNADVIPRPQKDQAQQRQHPIGFGLPLTDLAAAQQLDGVGQMNLPDGVEQDQKKDRADDQRRADNHTGKNLEGKLRHASPQQLHQQQEHQLVKQNAQTDSNDQTDQQQNQRFAEDDQRNVLLAHAQNV